MSEYAPTSGYPKTLSAAREQGMADRKAGYPSTWTPNLGPKSSDRSFWRAWEDGWFGVKEGAS